MSDFPITIFHNPACGTSRNVVVMVRAAGYEPEVIEYLKVGWTREKLGDLLTKMAIGPATCCARTGRRPPNSVF